LVLFTVGRSRWDAAVQMVELIGTFRSRYTADCAVTIKGFRIHSRSSRPAPLSISGLWRREPPKRHRRGPNSSIKTCH